MSKNISESMAHRFGPVTLWALFALFITVGLASNSATETETVVLFDGKSLAGWRQPTGNWMAAGRITIDPSLPAPTPKAQAYTVQSGDTLSKISKQFYGDANRYMKIFDANKDQLKDPNVIKPGQVLKIPAA